MFRFSEARLGIDWHLPYELRAFESALSEGIRLHEIQVDELENMALFALEHFTSKVRKNMQLGFPFRVRRIYSDWIAIATQSTSLSSQGDILPTYLTICWSLVLWSSKWFITSSFLVFSTTNSGHR